MFDPYGRNNNGWIGQNSVTPLNGYGRQLPHYEIVKVNGEAGARAIQMAPNSSLFLADATNPNLIWMAQTDGAGYLTATPLDVSFHQEKPQPNYSNLEERLKRLEEIYEFNSGTGKQSKKQRQQSTAAEQSADATN